MENTEKLLKAAKLELTHEETANLLINLIQEVEAIQKHLGLIEFTSFEKSEAEAELIEEEEQEHKELIN